MAETAKILNPDKLVLLPDLAAGCSLSDSCPAPAFDAFVRAHPGHTVITYINSSAAVKALSDIICTSSNAERIVRQIPADRPILFAPDQHLGRYVIKQTGRDMVLWPGVVLGARDLLRAAAHPAEGGAPRRAGARPPRVRGARAAPGRSHRLDDLHPQVRHHEPGAELHRRHRGGHHPPDEEGVPGQGVHPGAARQRVLVQRVPLHAPEHAREGLPVHARPAAGDHAARGAARQVPRRPCSGCWR